MDIETYSETSQPAGDQRGTDDNIAVTDLLNCLSRAAVDANASYMEDGRVGAKLGDVLWYVAAVARRRKLSLKDVAKQHLVGREPSTFDDYSDHTRPDDLGEDQNKAVQVLLNRLTREAATTTSAFLENPSGNDGVLKGLSEVFWHIAAVVRRLGLQFSGIAHDNLERTKSRFGASDSAPDLFDAACDPDEQLPRKISLRFSESVRNGLATVRMAIRTKDDVWLPIGSPLNDNSHEDDDYRFHDVLHLAYVAVLGWSPVMRALFGLKRKSSSKYDRVEDGARAILLEEALTGIVYEAASDDDLFRASRKLERRLLLTVKRLTRKLEVRVRTYDHWTDAIFSGYLVFREITEAARRAAAEAAQKAAAEAEKKKTAAEGEGNGAGTHEPARHIGYVNIDMVAKKIWFEPCDPSDVTNSTLVS